MTQQRASYVCTMQNILVSKTAEEDILEMIKQEPGTSPRQAIA